jgi:hypothetical protein
MKRGISVLHRGIGRWAREPLLHFLLIGAALFVIYHWLNPSAANSDTSRRIELTNDDIRQLEISWTAQWQRHRHRKRCTTWWRKGAPGNPLPWRTGARSGSRRYDRQTSFGPEDGISADDVSALRDPSLDELKKWYAKNGSQFSLPSRITFQASLLLTGQTRRAGAWCGRERAGKAAR